MTNRSSIAAGSRSSVSAGWRRLDSAPVVMRRCFLRVGDAGKCQPGIGRDRDRERTAHRLLRQPARQCSPGVQRRGGGVEAPAGEMAPQRRLQLMLVDQAVEDPPDLGALTQEQDLVLDAECGEGPDEDGLAPGAEAGDVAGGQMQGASISHGNARGPFRGRRLSWRGRDGNANAAPPLPRHCPRGRAEPAAMSARRKRTQSGNRCRIAATRRRFRLRAEVAAKLTPYFHAVSLEPRGRAYRGRAARAKIRWYNRAGAREFAGSRCVGADQGLRPAEIGGRSDRWRRHRRADPGAPRVPVPGDAGTGPTTSTRLSNMPRCRRRSAIWRRPSARSSAC